MTQAAKAHVVMLAFAFVVSTSFTVGRAITFALDPAALTFLRFGMAAGIFTGVAALSSERFCLPAARRWLKYFFLALLLVIFFVSMFEGLRWTTPLAASAVFTITPFITAIVSLVLLGQRLPAAGYLALAAAGLASLWIVFGGNVSAMLALKAGRGEMIFFAGCIAYAAYAPFVKKLHTGGGLVYLTLWTFVAGDILLFLYGFGPIMSTNWLLVSPLVYLGVAWLAVFTTAVSFYMLQYASLRLAATKVMSYTLLVPAFVLLQRIANGGAWPNMSTLAALAVLTISMLVLQKV